MDFFGSDDLLSILLKQVGSMKSKTYINSQLIEIERSCSEEIADGQVEEEIIQFEPKHTIQQNTDIVDVAEDFLQEIIKGKGINIILDKKTRQVKKKKMSCQNLSLEEVFKSKLIKKQGKKNTNLPKFLVRIFLKYFIQVQKSMRVQQFFNQIYSSFKARKANNFKIQDLQQLLGHSNSESYLSEFTRKFFRKTLRQALKEEIIYNAYVSSNRKTYMMTSKVYALRCRSKALVGRLQYR